MLGNKVKVLRGQLDLSRKDLAEDLSISYHALSKYETNEREPDIETLKKIANYFRITIDELLEMEAGDKCEIVNKEFQKKKKYVPVFEKLCNDIGEQNSKVISRYKEILAQNCKDEFFYYIAENNQFQSLRIHAGDKILFLKNEQMQDNTLVMASIDHGLPIICRIYKTNEFITLTMNSENKRPIIMTIDEAKDRIKIIGTALRVEFTP